MALLLNPSLINPDVDLEGLFPGELFDLQARAATFWKCLRAQIPQP